MSAERILLAVECPTCLEYTETPLSRLKAAERVECAACGRPIDVATGDPRAEIDRLFEVSMRR